MFTPSPLTRFLIDHQQSSPEQMREAMTSDIAEEVIDWMVPPCTFAEYLDKLAILSAVACFGMSEAEKMQIHLGFPILAEQGFPFECEGRC